MSKGLFHAYGQFWHRDQVTWNPGKGARGGFMLLGRKGERKSSLRLADFRHQNGIYILYGNHGLHYVGLTRNGGLGRRLKAHLTDKHRNEWQRFSWFSFGQVLKSRSAETGFQNFREVASKAQIDMTSIIGDLEAMLITVSANANVNQMRFAEAEMWHQVALGDVETYTARVKGL